jgi:7-keto-8-aminopelargonate synthetase-like enzyme
VLLPSGYQANHAAIQTLAGAAAAAGTRIRFLLDRLAHASLIDAVRGAEATFRVFPHNDLEKLERLLQRDVRDDNTTDADEIQVVVTESIFSMDGEPAPLAGFARLKEKYPFFLLLDEAHGSGVYGRDGAGYAAEIGVTAAVDLFIVTLSKALGCAGGAICASQKFCDGVANFGRAYIYSTALPPAAAAACEAALAVMRDEPQRQSRLRELTRRARARLNLPSSDCPIIPVIFGSEPAAVGAAESLRGEGLLVLPIRPPTVPAGTSRLRITLSCEHSDAEVEHLLVSLAELR